MPHNGSATRIVLVPTVQWGTPDIPGDSRVLIYWVLLHYLSEFSRKLIICSESFWEVGIIMILVLKRKKLRQRGSHSSSAAEALQSSADQYGSFLHHHSTRLQKDGLPSFQDRMTTAPVGGQLTGLSWVVQQVEFCSHLMWNASKSPDTLLPTFSLLVIWGGLLFVDERHGPQSAVLRNYS